MKVRFHLETGGHIDLDVTMADVRAHQTRVTGVLAGWLWTDEGGVDLAKVSGLKIVEPIDPLAGTWLSTADGGR
jgi:hypothetical protein